MNDQNPLSDLLANAIAAAARGVARLEGRCAAASGSVWSADGVIVTALHAIGPTDELRATFDDGRSLDARVVGRDPSTDLAVLRVDAADLTPLTWKDADGVRVGHLVTPLGRPAGALRATLGMVSSLGGAIRTAGGGTLDHHIEVDGSLPRGFSGGPLVDHTGGALGMNTGALVRGGVTVPTSTLRRVIPTLLTEGRVGRGFLGVGVHPVRVPESVASVVPQRWAVMVVSLDAGSPAAQAGMHVGDVVLSVEGAAVQHPGDLVAALSGRAHQSITLRVARAGELRDFTVRLGLRDA